MATKERQVKHTNLLYEAGLMDQRKLAMVDEAGRSYKQFANIEFKIISANEKEIVMQVKQGKNASGHHFDKKRLNEIVHETFDPVFPGIKIHAREIIPYEEPAFAVVTPEWVEKKMTALKIGHKDIIADLRIDKSNVSNYLNGDKPMSDATRSLLYYYFLYRELAG
jgi:hypothetical protein